MVWPLECDILKRLNSSSLDASATQSRHRKFNTKDMLKRELWKMDDWLQAAKYKIKELPDDVVM